MFEERDGDRWGPRKFFCAAPGSDGLWCNSNSHCGAGSVCSLWRCTAPKADYELCASSEECINNACELVWGLDKKCKPTAGWSDNSECTANNHCNSNSCVEVYLADRKCKPSGGFANNEYCKQDSHCSSGRCDAGTCRAKLGDYSVCVNNGDCVSNACRSVWGLDKKCKPTAGWSDYSECTANNHCNSNSCVTVFAADRKCKPSDGWARDRQCTTTNHCKSNEGLTCHGGYCRAKMYRTRKQECSETYRHYGQNRYHRCDPLCGWVCHEGNWPDWGQEGDRCYQNRQRPAYCLIGSCAFGDGLVWVESGSQCWHWD